MTFKDTFKIAFACVVVIFDFFFLTNSLPNFISFVVNSTNNLLEVFFGHNLPSSSISDYFYSNDYLLFTLFIWIPFLIILFNILNAIVIDDKIDRILIVEYVLLRFASFLIILQLYFLLSYKYGYSRFFHTDNWILEPFFWSANEGVNLFHLIYPFVIFNLLIGLVVKIDERRERLEGY